MARYIGPKTKIARKFGDPIFGSDKILEKKNYPPGMHGNNKKERYCCNCWNRGLTMWSTEWE
jgi:small subunit ribosomal protein S4